MEYDVWQATSGEEKARAEEVGVFSGDDQQIVSLNNKAEDDEAQSSSRLYKDDLRQRSAIEIQTRNNTSRRFSFSKIRSVISNLLPSSSAGRGRGANLSSEEYLRNLNSDANINWTVLPDPESQASLCRIPEGLELPAYCDPDDLNGNSEAKKFQSQFTNLLNSLTDIQVNTKCSARTNVEIGIGFTGPKTEDTTNLLEQTFKSWRLGHPKGSGGDEADQKVLEDCDTSVLLMIHLGLDGGIRIRHAEGGFITQTFSSSTLDKTLQIAETQTSAFPPRTKPIRAAIMVTDLLRLQFTRQVRLPRQPSQAYALAVIFAIITILFAGALIQTYKTMMERAATNLQHKKKKKRGKARKDNNDDDQEHLLKDVELQASPESS